MGPDPSLPGSAAFVDFFGGGYLTFSSGCAPNGWFGKTYFDARHRPPGVGDNGPGTRLAVFWGPFYAAGFERSDGPIGKKYVTVKSGGVGNSSYSNPFTTKLRFSNISPNKITEKTKFINIRGRIRQLDDLPGCNVGFRLSFSKTP